MTGEGVYVGRNCWTSPYTMNKGISITGNPGSGKTSRMNRIELMEANNEKTVIVLDTNCTHADEMIYAPIKKGYLERTNRINVKTDGLNIEFLKPIQGKSGQNEDFVDVINAAVWALGGTQRMGNCQIGALREALIFAMEHREEFADEMTAIKEGLLRQENATANGVYQRLWTVINSKVFRTNEKYIQPGMINLISFVGIDKITQSILVEILLSALWRTAKYQGDFYGGERVLSVDEFQNLPLREGSMLRDILREGRKFGISLLLATQTLKVFPKETVALLDQMGTKLYFRPAMSEVRSIAKEIAPDDIERWVIILSQLRCGEAVDVGSFMVGVAEVNHPILTR